MGSVDVTWRSLKQNILIEFGKRMTLWVLDFAYTIVKSLHYFWNRARPIRNVDCQILHFAKS